MNRFEPEWRPQVSVVIATHNRAHLLDTLLDALDRQEDVDSFEVIVVDDASTDATQDVLAAAAARLRHPLRALRVGDNGGPAVARNLGWRAASAPVVAFTDDDCVPQPGWLAALTTALAGGADIAQGMTRPAQGDWERRGPFSHTVWVLEDKGFYETCNIAYRREVLERVGGFDETFRYRVSRSGRHPIFGEDADLGWRAVKTGARTTFVSGALVHHAVWPSSYVDHLRAMRRRDGVAMLMRRHPEARRALHHGVFQEPTHPWALVALASIAAGARPRAKWPTRLLAAIGCAPYVATLHRFRPFPARGRNVYLIPMAFVAEVLEIAVCVRSSLRNRTIVF